MSTLDGEGDQQLVQLELEETLREQQGMTFRFYKTGGKFIHTYCTGRLLLKLGLTPEEVVGRELIEFYPAQIAIRKETFYARAWEGEENVTYEGEIGGVSYLASLRPIRVSGKIVEVVASCVDITERKRAEEELRATKELLDSLFRNSADGICVTDTAGKVIRVNAAYLNMYGWTEEELVGRELPIYPDYLKHELGVICTMLQSGNHIVNQHAVRQRKDGELLHVCNTISPLKDGTGKVIAMAGITRDISEQKKAEDFLQKADKLNVVGQLAAGLAHEIRNPLTTLRGLLQLMHSSGSGKLVYYDILISELDRINSMVSELILIAKPHVTSLRTHDLAVIVPNVINLLESQAAISNIQIVFESEGALPFIRCSEVEIKQVFINLLKNAIEAMPNGGAIRVVASAQPHQHVRIRIIDQGGGITEEQIRRLGEPFYTTKEKGTGLGLMMCYKIIGDHGGKIAVTSVIGKGTTVEVVLPVSV
ncbi:MAG: sporulation kinase [Paenibacillus sp.]|uniref:PAS domain S-box protein n=1 Tax=Paenibacillus sp. GCM10012303 TaxID=3317340 RepID=UPI0029F05836|nr:sporulation kinase [Paenibacillus sp.]